jgi:hypothetical protein
MQNWVVENDIVEFSDLATYAGKERFIDWFPLLTDSSTVFMNAFIRSRRHRLNQNDR